MRARQKPERVWMAERAMTRRFQDEEDDDDEGDGDGGDSVSSSPSKSLWINQGWVILGMISTNRTLSNTSRMMNLSASGS